jgi:hypothetical protein
MTKRLGLGRLTLLFADGVRSESAEVCASRQLSQWHWPSAVSVLSTNQRYRNQRLISLYLAVLPVKHLKFVFLGRGRWCRRELGLVRGGPFSILGEFFILVCH